MRLTTTALLCVFVIDIEFFELEDGRKPIEEFLNSLEVEMRAKVLQNIKILKEFGYDLRQPFSAPIGDGIFELRTQADGNITRILYFFYVDNVAMLTNGFVKKTRKTPSNEIEKARNYRKFYLQRKEREHNGRF